MTCAINSVLDIFKMLCRDDSHGRHGHCIPCIARVQTGYVHKFLMGKNINRYFIYSGVRGQPVWGAVMSVWGTWSPADITAFITGPNKAGLSNWDLVVHCAHKQLRIFMTNDATPTITKWWHSNVVGISCVLMCQVICPAAYNNAQCMPSWSLPPLVYWIAIRGSIHRLKHKAFPFSCLSLPVRMRTLTFLLKDFTVA